MRQYSHEATAVTVPLVRRLEPNDRDTRIYPRRLAGWLRLSIVQRYCTTQLGREEIRRLFPAALRLFPQIPRPLFGYRSRTLDGRPLRPFTHHADPTCQLRYGRHVELCLTSRRYFRRCTQQFIVASQCQPRLRVRSLSLYLPARKPTDGGQIRRAANRMERTRHLV